jgi:hypothetical protein
LVQIHYFSEREPVGHSPEARKQMEQMRARSLQSDGIDPN